MATEETGLVRHAHVALTPIMDVPQALDRLKQLQEFCASYLQESKDGGADGGDYGIIPGAGKKKVLFKSGAEKLCDIYGLADRYRILTMTEDFDKGLFDYTMECELVRKADGMFVGSGLGAASSYESKYRWRETRRVCPQCGAEAIIKGKAEYGGGWLCWNKKGGCGAKFADADPAILNQKIGRVENPDLSDSKNTILKMAKKRAKIDAVIGVTRSSGIFTLDLMDHLLDTEVVDGETVETPAPTKGHDRDAGHAEPPANETHAQKVARIKAEAKAERAAGKPGPKPVPTPEPTPEPEPAPDDPVAGDVDVAAVQRDEPAPAPVAAEVVGVRVANVKPMQGPMVMKDGQQKPSWVLYVVTFTSKVKAENGLMVADAATFDEKLAAVALDARDAKKIVAPKIVPNEKKKGNFTLKAL